MPRYTLAELERIRQTAFAEGAAAGERAARTALQSDMRYKEHEVRLKAADALAKAIESNSNALNGIAHIFDNSPLLRG